MFSHVLDHFVFSSKRVSHQTKTVVFGIFTTLLILSFWWFKGVAFGIDGPIGEHKGLQWRKVRVYPRCVSGANANGLPLPFHLLQSWNIYEEN
jgi:hypothetical protein